MKKSIVLVASTAVLLSALAPSLVNVVQADQVVPKTEVNAQNVMADTPSSNFINKFDDAVKVINNLFIIDYSNLPQNTSSSELQSLKALIDQKNSIILKSENLNDGTTLEKDNNSVIISSNSNNSMLRFREGSNYVHVYWWGLRIELSKITINYIGGGVAIGGIWVPEPIVSKILATLGVAIGLAPGGIVFNSTPGIANFWGAGWQ
ncbi:hypothetical protein [Lactococcus garvieae]|uniref:hypothetical protein n=1 Tax=Lactococcus garvieae TaxID=1363 RepID=UPI00398F359C